MAVSTYVTTNKKAGPSPNAKAQNPGKGKKKRISIQPNMLVKSHLFSEFSGCEKIALWTKNRDKKYEYALANLHGNRNSINSWHVQNGKGEFSAFFCSVFFTGCLKYTFPII